MLPSEMDALLPKACLERSMLASQIRECWQDLQLFSGGFSSILFLLQGELGCSAVCIMSRRSFEGQERVTFPCPINWSIRDESWCGLFVVPLFLLRLAIGSPNLVKLFYS